MFVVGWIRLISIMYVQALLGDIEIEREDETRDTRLEQERRRNEEEGGG